MKRLRDCQRLWDSGSFTGGCVRDAADRIEALQRLCGRAEHAVASYQVEDCPYDQPAPDQLRAELREAAGNTEEKA